MSAGGLEGKNPLEERVRERTGCTIVALRRRGTVSMDFPPDLVLASDDALYICGTTDAIARYRDEFPAQWL